MIQIIKIFFSLAVLGGCFVFVKLTSIGPVIFVISEKHGWGVHSGDLLTIPFGLLALWLLVSSFMAKNSL